jgi:two-component system chemotaxis response regulator CheB
MDENGSIAGRASPIRVLVADDSVVMRSALARMLKDNPNIQLCGFAAHGVEAVTKARLLKPDVITLDVLMPVMDGIEALRQIMQQWPCAVIMVSSLTRHGAEVTVEALSMGAFDYIVKEELFLPDARRETQHLLAHRVEAAARSALYSNRTRYSARQNVAPRRQPPAEPGHLRNGPPAIIAIGASTGGPKALETILTALPGDLHVPIVVVQHMPPGFTSALAQRLDQVCELRVHEARQGEDLQPGCVYIAPAGQQMTVFDTERHTLHTCLSDTPHTTLHKPSADVLMLSVAKVFGCRSLGVILTGMGSDGLEGMAGIQNAGGITIGQDEATSAVYGMPRVCAERGVLQKILPLEAIASHLVGEFRAAAHA